MRGRRDGGAITSTPNSWVHPLRFEGPVLPPHPEPFPRMGAAPPHTPACATCYKADPGVRVGGQGTTPEPLSYGCFPSGEGSPSPAPRGALGGGGLLLEGGCRQPVPSPLPAAPPISSTPGRCRRLMAPLPPPR